VATQLVQEGEKILCEAQNGQEPQCDVLVAGTGRAGAAAIGLDYLSWARETAPESRNWGAYTGTLRQQAVITASALFSQALAGRGGNDGNLVRCAYRDDDDPANKYYNVGLRVVIP
jgi:hypothetical protein